jgi:hypothetical protein
MSGLSPTGLGCIRQHARSYLEWREKMIDMASSKNGAGKVAVIGDRVLGNSSLLDIDLPERR